MLGAAMCWKTEGVRGDSWFLCARERMEMECLVLPCAGRRWEEDGIPGALYTVEKGSEMEFLVLLWKVGRGRKEGMEIERPGSAKPVRLREVVGEVAREMELLVRKLIWRPTLPSLEWDTISKIVH
jgi:hypothetical protein